MYPWHGDHTFSEVLKVIDPSNPDKQPIDAYEWARDRLILWQVKTTSSHCLPEIEATLSLLTALIKDRKCLDGNNETHQKLTIRSYDICTFYGMSLVKFCNLLPHYEMNKKGKVIRVNKKSRKTIRDLGISLDLPTWVLECRHKTCHASTNSLILLRQANHFALSWIFKHFWYKKIEEEEEESNNSDNNLSKLGAKVEKWLIVTGSAKNTILKEKIQQTIRDHPKQAFPIIIDILLRESSYKLSESFMDIGEFSVKEIKPYAKIIQLIDSLESLELFLHHLTKFFTDNDSKKARASVLWFKSITKCLSKQADDKASRMLALPQISPEVEIIIWQRLLYKATRKLTEFTPELVDHLSSLIPDHCIPSEITQLLKELAISSIQVKKERAKKSPLKTKTNIDENSSTYSVKTLDDLTSVMSKSDDQTMDTSS